MFTFVESSISSREIAHYLDDERALHNPPICHFDRREKSITIRKCEDFSSLMLLEMTKFKALDDEYGDLQQYLIKCPEAGDMIPGSGAGA